MISLSILNWINLKSELITGSTLISLILEGNRFITVINIGDSRAVACDIAGRAVPLSVDHKPSNVR